MRFGRGARQAPVSVSERWRQVFKIGQAELHGFTGAQLAAVSLQDDALPAERGPVLHATAVPAAESAADDPVVDLERQGYVRPWPPAGADGPIAEELPGWAEVPGEGRRQVAPQSVSIAGSDPIAFGIHAVPVLNVRCRDFLDTRFSRMAGRRQSADAARKVRAPRFLSGGFQPRTIPWA